MALKDFFKKYKGCSFWYKIKRLRVELRYAWKRAYYGYDDFQIFNFDIALIEDIITRLKELVKYIDAYPEHLGFTFETWKDKINEIIMHFEFVIDENFVYETLFGKDYIDKKLSIEQHEKASGLVKEHKVQGFKLLVEYLDHLWY